MRQASPVPCLLPDSDIRVGTDSDIRVGTDSEEVLDSTQMKAVGASPARFVYLDHYQIIILTSYSTTTPTPSLPAAPPSRRRREQTQVASRPGRLTCAGSRLTVTMRSRAPLMHWRMVCRTALSAVAHKHVQRRSRRPTRRIPIAHHASRLEPCFPKSDDFSTGHFPQRKQKFG